MTIWGLALYFVKLKSQCFLKIERAEVCFESLIKGIKL